MIKDGVIELRVEKVAVLIVCPFQIDVAFELNLADTACLQFRCRFMLI